MESVWLSRQSISLLHLSKLLNAQRVSLSSNSNAFYLEFDCSKSEQLSKHRTDWLTHKFFLLDIVTPDAFCSTPKIPCTRVAGVIPGLKPVCMNLYSSCSNPDIRQSYGSVTNSLFALALILAFCPILYLCLTHYCVFFDF